jgi:hypothetical protein
LLTRSHKTSISSHFSRSGAICSIAVKYWLELSQFIFILKLVTSEGIIFIGKYHSVVSTFIHNCIIQSAKSEIGLFFILSSQVIIISQNLFKAESAVKNLVEVQEFHKNSVFQFHLIFDNHQFIIKVSQFSTISTHKSFKAFIM